MERLKRHYERFRQAGGAKPRHEPPRKPAAVKIPFAHVRRPRSK